MGINSKQPAREGLTRRDVLKYGIYGGLAAGLSGSLWIGGCKQRGGNKPNVVVVLIDTLRPDYLGFYGYRKQTAAFLAKLAKESVVFKRAFAPSSWTAPSTTSLFTSKYPHRHGVMEGFFAHKRHVEQFRETGKAEIPLNCIPKDLPTLPAIFKSMGYTTFGTAANINICSEIGFSRGFDQFDRMYKASAKVIHMWIKKWEEKIKGAKPFFLYIHLNDVHMPYLKHQPYYEEQNNPREDFRARYIGEIGYADEYIGKIYKTLDLADNTIFVVVSDHGEEFWEHGGIGHLAKMHRELTQALMLFHAPSLGLEPQYVNVNVSLIDVLPTLVELVNGKPVQAAEGVSLMPLLRTGKAASRLAEELHNRILFAHRIEDAITSPEHHWSKENPELQHWAAIYRHWNLIERWDSSEELFDHNHDLMEQHNVFSKNPKVASQLLTELHEFKKQGLRKDIEKAPVNLDEDMLENLKSLGYLK